VVSLVYLAIQVCQNTREIRENSEVNRRKTRMASATKIESRTAGRSASRPTAYRYGDVEAASGARNRQTGRGDADTMHNCGYSTGFAPATSKYGACSSLLREFKPRSPEEAAMNATTPLAALALVTLLCAALDASAQDGSTHPLFTDDWLFRAGGQQADADVTAGLANEQLGNIPVIDLSGSGVDTEVTSFWGNVLWQAPARWSLGFTYFLSEAEGSRVSDSDFTFGNLVIPAGTGISTNFSTDFYVFNAYYDFFQRPDRSAGVGLGLYALDLEISAQAQVGGQPTGAREQADALAPLPTLSAYYKHAFNEKWAWMADVSWLSANIDQYDGEVLAARVSLEYWINRNWGLGAGYTYVDLDLTVDERVFDQLYEVQYDSLYFFATFGF
jgi:hypothetical protein